MAQKVRSCGIITLGAVIYALAFDWFVAPNQIAMGGVTGLAQIVNALVPVLPVGVLSILVNVPLFLAGWRLLGGRLLVSSLYAMAVSSLAIDVIAWMHTFPPMDPAQGGATGRSRPLWGRGRRGSGESNAGVGSVHRQRVDPHHLPEAGGCRPSWLRQCQGVDEFAPGKLQRHRRRDEHPAESLPLVCRLP